MPTPAQRARQRQAQRPAARAAQVAATAHRPAATPAAVAATVSTVPSPTAGVRHPASRVMAGQHPLTVAADNERLWGFERQTKDAYGHIVPTLKELAARQHDTDFVDWAQRFARERLGFELPQTLLANAWVDRLDLKALFAFATFETFRRMSSACVAEDPLLARARSDKFSAFLRDCGFHAMNVTPCADGRLAHAISYVLRLPMGAVRRKSYAGAMFDIEEAMDRWGDVELRRYREGVPSLPMEPTRYLKVVMYHYSSVDPDRQGCAAHGSDTRKAAEGGWAQLQGFREAIENTFCCGASVDILLLGLDTDTDAIRAHLPDRSGQIDFDAFLDAGQLYDATRALSTDNARAHIEESVRQHARDRGAAGDGMCRLIARLFENNFSQIDYVRHYHNAHYSDVGHEERFVGVGVDFAEIQLRNLTYFAFMRTVEEGAPDLDVGIKIFRRLNVAQGLPVPIVVRFEYSSQVPGSRDRAVQRCERVADAIVARYPDLAEQGLVHTFWTLHDCASDGPVECVGSSVPGWEAALA